MVVALQLVDELMDLVDRVARHDPERLGLVPSAVELLRVELCRRKVGRGERAGVLERLTAAFLPKDLEDHAASGSTTPRTHAVSARDIRRSSSRSFVFGP